MQSKPIVKCSVAYATLDRSPERLLTFLRGAAEPSIATRLSEVGLTVKRLDEAWALLNLLRLETVVASPPDPDRNAEAVAACERWQATALVRARAMLQLQFPEQGRFLFHDFALDKGAAAVLNVVAFIGRRAVLQYGPARKATRKVDREALDLLAETGITMEVVEAMRATVVVAQRMAPVVPRDEGRGAAAAARLEALRKIHAWITAWSEVARTVVSRRDHQIRLGIAKRRPRKEKAA